ncbi:MAG: DNA methylase, partial [Muribaculaceae bacterium]|nr:DNA methylase [Muribaculaceae bacterium]
VESLTDPFIRAQYSGKVSIDRYGRKVPAHSHGTINLPLPTSSGSILTSKTAELFDRIVNPILLIRRLTLSINRLRLEETSKPKPRVVQLDLFTDYEKEEERIRKEDRERERERRRQETILNIRKRFGKNAILKGINYAEGATQRERNKQIGGHHE